MKRTRKKGGFEFHVVLPPKNLVLTNDPSITAWGWAIVDPSDNTVVDCGCIKTVPQSKVLRTRKGDDRVRRVQEITFALIQVVEKHHPALILSELPHGSQSAVAAVMIGIATGVMQTLGDCFKIPVEWFSEGDAKMAVVGARSVAKDTMVGFICELFQCDPWKKTKADNQAIADSLAVYYVGRQQSTSLKMLAVTN